MKNAHKQAKQRQWITLVWDKSRRQSKNVCKTTVTNTDIVVKMAQQSDIDGNLNTIPGLIRLAEGTYKHINKSYTKEVRKCMKNSETVFEEKMAMNIRNTWRHVKKRSLHPLCTIRTEEGITSNPEKVLDHCQSAFQTRLKKPTQKTSLSK
ncbi:pentatricopeptide repeat-containing protein [Acrasis kona]|uniref:Pentatricopeptide repeat-containing protein n=1 Tax=Acrasis kona TaxID=1008807 RepID=A0AAW2ZR32_9EUKA